MTEQATEEVETQAETPGATTPTTETPVEAQAAPVEATPIEIPDEFKGADGNADVALMLSRIQELSAPAEGVPDKPEGYELKLNEEVKLFNGQEVQLNDKDPMLPEFFAWAHKNGLSQEAAQEAMTLYAKGQAEMLKQQYSVSNEQVQQEIAKLGANPEQRVQSLMSSVGKAIGNEEKAFALISNVRQVEAFEAIESLMNTINGQGGGRAPALNGVIVERPPLHQRLFGKVN